MNRKPHPLTSTLSEDEVQTRRLFRVEIAYEIYVSAFDAKEAARWAERNVTEWSSDPPSDVHALPMTKSHTLSEEILSSLPWAADGLSDEESDKTIEWWLERASKDQEP